MADFTTSTGKTYRLPKGPIYQGLPSFDVGPGDAEGIQGSDFFKGVMGGFAGIGQGLGWLAHKTGIDPNRYILDLGTEAVDFWHNSLSESARRELSKTLIEQNEDGDYVWGGMTAGGAALNLAQMVPGFMGSMGAGAAVTAGLRGAANLAGRNISKSGVQRMTAAGQAGKYDAGTLGQSFQAMLQAFGNPMGRQALVEAVQKGAAAGASTTARAVGAEAAKKLAVIDSALGIAGFGAGVGLTSTGQNAASVQAMIERQDHTTLAERSPSYQRTYESLIQAGVDPADAEIEAKRTVAGIAATEAGWKSGLTVALLGAPAAAFFGKLLGARASGVAPQPVSRAQATRRGAQWEGLQELGQSGAETYYTLRALDEHAGVESDIFGQTISNALLGAVGGGLMGGGFAALGYKAPGVRANDPDTDMSFRAEQGRVWQQVRRAFDSVPEADRPAFGEALAAINARLKTGDTRVEQLAALETFVRTGEMPRESRGLDAELNEGSPDDFANAVQRLARDLKPAQLEYLRVTDPLTGTGNLRTLRDLPPADQYIVFQAKNADDVQGLMGEGARNMLSGHVGRAVSEAGHTVYHASDGVFVAPVASKRAANRLRKTLRDIPELTYDNGQQAAKLNVEITSARASRGGEQPWDTAVARLNDQIAAERTEQQQQTLTVGEQQVSVPEVFDVATSTADPAALLRQTGVDAEPGAADLTLTAFQARTPPQAMPELTASTPAAPTLTVEGKAVVPEQATEIDAQRVIDEAAHSAATSPFNQKPLPTDRQAESGRYEMGHVQLPAHGVHVSIENPAGSVRSGTDPATGETWSRRLNHHYGKIDRVKGADDGDLDVFLGPSPHNPMLPVFVMNQRTPEGAFDEHKVLLGFKTAEEALEAYRSNYETNNPYEGDLSQLSAAEFRAWRRDASQNAPAPNVVVEGPAQAAAAMIVGSDINSTLEVTTTPTAEANEAVTSVPVPHKYSAEYGSTSDAQRAEIASAVSDLAAAGMPLSLAQRTSWWGVLPESDQAQGKNVPGEGIGIRADVLDWAMRLRDDPATQQSFRVLIAHELGHTADNDHGTGLGQSLRSPLFDLGDYSDGALETAQMGPVMAEMLHLWQADVDGLNAFLNYPFDLELVAMLTAAREGDMATAKDTEYTLRAEVFAQAFALYYHMPEMLKQEAPRTFQLIQEVSDAHNTQSGGQRIARLQKAFRSPGTPDSLAGPFLTGDQGTRAQRIEGRQAGPTVEEGVGFTADRLDQRTVEAPESEVGAPESGALPGDGDVHFGNTPAADHVSPETVGAFQDAGVYNVPENLAVVDRASEAEGNPLLEGQDASDVAMVFDPASGQGLMIGEAVDPEVRPLLVAQQMGYGVTLQAVVGEQVSRRLAHLAEDGTIAGVLSDPVFWNALAVKEALARTKGYLNEHHGMVATNEVAARFLAAAASGAGDGTFIVRPGDDGGNPPRKPGDPIDIPLGVRVMDTRGKLAQWERLFSSATDVLRQTTGGEPIANAIAGQLDRERQLSGQMSSIMFPVLREFGRLSRTDRQQVENDMGLYWQAYTYGGDYQSIYDNAKQVTRDLIDAWGEVADQTHTLMRNLGVQVHDGDGKWRPIGKAQIFFPRVFSREVVQTMQNRERNANTKIMWNRMVDALIAQGHIETRAEADKYIKSQMVPDVHRTDFFAGMEMARKQALPAIFYDWTLQPMNQYIHAWAKRFSQIEAYGQDTGEGDAFSRKDGWLDQFKGTNVERYIQAVRDRVFDRRLGDGFERLMATLNMIATGTQIANPGTAFGLNLPGGLSLNGLAMGWDHALKAFTDTVKAYKDPELFNDMTRMGIVRDDMWRILNDNSQHDQMSGMLAGDLTGPKLRQAVAWLMRWGGYMPTEQFIRIHGALTGKYQLQSALEALNANPDSNKAKAARAFFERHGFDVDRFAREGMQGTYFERWMRYASNIAQGTYQVDQTPVWADTPAGRFFFKYMKFGTQVNRLVWQNHVMPFVQSTQGGIEISTGDRVKTFIPMMRFIATAYVAGSAIGLIRETLFDYLRPGPQLDELEKALADDDRARKLSVMFSHAYHVTNHSGFFGLIGNMGQSLMDYRNQSRSKNPLNPPGMASVEGVGSLLMRMIGQRKLTGRDIDQTLERYFAAYRTTKRPLIKAWGLAYEESMEANAQSALADRRYISGLTSRYARQTGIEGHRMIRGSGIIGATPMTPINQSITRAIRAGEPYKARMLVQEALADMEREDRERAMQSIRASVRNAQPLTMFGRPLSQRQRSEFLRWARDNVGDANYQRITHAEQEYRRAALRAGLL